MATSDSRKDDKNEALRLQNDSEERAYLPNNGESHAALGDAFNTTFEACKIQEEKVLVLTNDIKERTHPPRGNDEPHAADLMVRHDSEERISPPSIGDPHAALGTVFNTPSESCKNEEQETLVSSNDSKEGTDPSGNGEADAAPLMLTNHSEERAYLPSSGESHAALGGAYNTTVDTC